MKKVWMILLVALLCVMAAACSNKEGKDSKASASKEENKMVTYKSETGDIQVPANPKRVVALTNAGNVVALGVNLVGVEQWSKKSPLYTEQLKNTEVVSDEDVEKIIELKPDLIIAPNTAKNLGKLKKIAPTVTYTYNKLNYMDQQVEIGRLVGKEDEAKKWVADYKERASKLGKEIKAKIGENATVTVMESSGKSIYVLGDNWGRGTEVLFQQMGLKMQEKTKKDTVKSGYFTLSQEVLGEYVGDYLIISKFADQENAYEKTNAYKNIPAVKNGHVYAADGYAFIFNDPIAIDYALNFFKESFLGKK